MDEEKLHMDRRYAIKTLALGALAVGAAGCKYEIKSAEPVNASNTGHGKKATWEKVVAPSDVSLIKGNDPRDNVFNALKKIEDEIMAGLEGKKRVLIKPNFVFINNPLCATKVEAVRGILDFIKPRFKGPIEIGEATVSGANGWNAGTEGTMGGFRDYGYLPLEKEYGVTLTDLNQAPHEIKYVFSEAGNRPVPIRIISKFLDNDQYLISAGKMKTHNCVLVTLSLKNILMGCPKNDYSTQNDKFLMHGTGNASPFTNAVPGKSINEMDASDLKISITKDMVLHYNLFHMAQNVFPDLGVIDAFESMEGAGPHQGTPVDTRLALASVDPLALDFVGTRIMGFDPLIVDYLASMYEAGMGQGDMNKINILGANLNDCLFNFKPHPSLAEPYGLV